MVERLKRLGRWVQEQPLVVAVAAAMVLFATLDGALGFVERVTGFVAGVAPWLADALAFLRSVPDNVWAGIAGGLVMYALLRFTRDRARYEGEIAELRRSREAMAAQLKEQAELLADTRTTTLRVWDQQIRAEERQRKAERDARLRGLR